MEATAARTDPSFEEAAGEAEFAAAQAAVRDVFDLQLSSIMLFGRRVAFLDEGEGPPLVLLHGAPMTSLAFARLVRELRGRYRVIAPDFPGFGYSAPSPAGDGSLAGYSRFVEAFCRGVGLGRFYLYVNDASGGIGLDAASRMAADVAGVIVADTVPIPLTGRAAPVRLLLRSVFGLRLVRWLNRRMRLLPWLVVRVAPLLRLRPFPRAERALLLAQFDNEEKCERVAAMFREMGRDQAFMRSAAEHVREKLGDTPALILFGQLDPMRLVGGVGRWRAMFRSSAVAMVSLEEHFPILASADRVARAIDEWISGVEAKAP